MSTLDINNESDKISQNKSPSVGLLSKLRRMKIQEDLIIQSIKKNFCEADNSFIKYDLEYKKYLTKFKTSYADIKQLLDDLKCVTQTQVTLQKSDIDEVKKDVLELDEKLKTFKTFLHRELAFLKSSEQHLTKQMNEDESQNYATKKPRKVLTKTYSDIIPSPVRNMINSPFKYPEVQQFQDFLSHSNKHGGWNEYNHNIFVKLWQKHFQNDDECFRNETLDDTDRSLFISDVFENVSGINKADIISHIEWYTKYLSLKKQQQLAIEEWRAKTKPKKAFQQCSEQTSSLDHEKVKAWSRPLAPRSLKTETDRKYGEITSGQTNSKEIKNNPSSTDQNYSSINDAKKFLKQMDRALNSKSAMDKEVPELRYTKPTKQWNNRCKSSEDTQFQFKDLDNITKLGIPRWRLKLINNDS